MAADIEQRVEDLLKHAGVWDETKETLRELLAEHKAGTLDPEDARYIEGLHKKMCPGRAGASAAPAAKTAAQATREVREVKADNDDMVLPSARAGHAASELIAALRQDIAGLVTPADISERPEAEQALRREILAALHARLDEFDAREKG
jgi:hypothetical protein